MSNEIYKTHQEALEDSGFPNATPLSYGIGDRVKVYRFDDEKSGMIVTIKKSRKGFYFSHAVKRYGRTGLGVRGFDIK